MAKAFIQRLCLVVCAILFTLLMLESGVRFSGIWVKDSYDNRNYFIESDLPGVPYTLKPNARATWAGTSIVSNAEGIRSDRDYGVKKEGVFRILTVGDSITFGMGVDQSEAFPQQLEALLNRYKKTESTYEVINAGISGFSAVDEACFLDHLNARYQPDLIIWMLIPNDYDDSLGVNDNGQMTFDIPTYAATNSWLELTWGLTGPSIDPDNFLASMGPRQQSWALDKPMPAPEGGLSAVGAFLNQQSYLYSLISARIQGTLNKRRLDHRVISRDPDVLDRNVAVRFQDGSVDILPEISSIFVSPFYGKRFDTAIKKGIRSAVDRRIPMLILSFNVAIAKALSQGQDRVWIQDICEYLGMPASRFRQRYNLGWDPHLNAKGNQLLAYGIMQLMKDKGLFMFEQRKESAFFDRTLFWQQYERELATFTSRIGTYIDFKHFRNIHQLVGGMYPPRIFPIKGNARLSVILKNPHGAGFRIAGNNGNPPQSVIVWLSDGNSGVDTHLTIPTGDFRLVVDIPDSRSFRGNLIDAHLYCREGSCREMKIDFLGFDDGGSLAEGHPQYVMPSHDSNIN